jgi:hypothetical protein
MFRKHKHCAPQQRYCSKVFHLTSVMEHLTSLEVFEDTWNHWPPSNAHKPLHLQLLPQLAVLRLSHLTDPVDSSTLSGLSRLTDLSLGCGMALVPSALAYLTQLSCLYLCSRCRLGFAPGVSELLSILPELQQLRLLNVASSLCFEGPPAAAFSALVASSELRSLDISGCTLPEHVWQHVFPTGRQLPRLMMLNISEVKHPSSDYRNATAPEGSRLVSCCPGLQSLEMRRLQHSAEQLAPLKGLSRLRRLQLGHRFDVRRFGVCAEIMNSFSSVLVFS